MKSLLLLFFVSITLSLSAQTYPSSCLPAGDAAAIYRSNAYKLAVKRLTQVGSPYADSVIIPEIFIDSIENALYAVHNVQGLAVADTIRSFYGSSTFTNNADSSHITIDGNNFSSKQIQVAVNSNPDWDSINNVAGRYQLVITTAPQQNVPGGTSYLVTSAVAINTVALLKLFKNIPGVIPAYSNAVTMMPHSNKDLVVEYESGKIILSYKYGCGDCSSGCTVWRTWKFKVNTDTDCSVDYLFTDNSLFPMMWIPYPCLDYMQTIQLCANAASASFESFHSSGPGLQWKVSIDGVNYSNISNNSYYSGVNASILQLTNVPSSWNGYTYLLTNNGASTKTFFKIKFVNECVVSGTVNWEDLSGWSCGVLPDSNTDVVIKSGTVNINSNVTIRTLKILPGATVNVAAGYHLTVLQ